MNAPQKCVKSLSKSTCNYGYWKRKQLLSQIFFAATPKKDLKVGYVFCLSVSKCRMAFRTLTQGWQGPWSLVAFLHVGFLYIPIAFSKNLIGTPDLYGLVNFYMLPGRWFLWSGSSVAVGGTGGVRLGITPGLWWSALSLVFISVWLADGEVLDGDIP